MTDTLATGAASAENPVKAPTDAAAAPAGDITPDKASAAPAPAPADPGASVAKTVDVGSDDDGPFGKDWREKLAKGDAKRLDRLARFPSPLAILESFEEAQRKISEGLKPKGKPGPKATPEEWADYRKQHAIPDTVEDYVKAIALPDGRVIGDDDKPIVAAFAERAVKKGVAPADMAEMVDEYYALQEDMLYQQKVADDELKASAFKALQDEWGGDLKANFAAMRPYFESVNPELFDNLMAGRLADGSKIGNHPDILRFFAAKAVAENPMATVLPSGSTGMEGLTAEIAAMETRMREDRVGWGRDMAAQERYRKLITARDKLPA